MRASFKIKIALLSLALSGTLLTAFGLLFFTFAYNAGINRMDQEIRTLAEPSLHRRPPLGYWENFDRSLSFIYGEQATSRVALYVIHNDTDAPFVSENAPPGLADLFENLKLIPVAAAPEGTSSEQTFSGRLDINEDGRISFEEFDGSVRDFSYLDADGDRFISIEEALNRRRIPAPPRNRYSEPPPLVEPIFQILETDKGNWRAGLFQTPSMSVIMAMDMEVFYHDIKRFQTAFLIAVPVGLVLLALAGWFLARRAMRPVACIADTAEGITARGLDRRIPVFGSDTELERLVRVINDMLDRLEKSYRQAVRFSADAAHELQTPLTILQGELDNAIQASEAGSPEQQRYSMLMEELSHLKSVIQKLLLLAHADEGCLKLNLTPLDLSQMVRSSAEDLEIMAPQLQVELRGVETTTVSADVALLSQAVRNMISNAAKYTDPGGVVRFTLETADEVAKFTLENKAPPIPLEDQLQLFERFYRVEKSRTTAGSGLGLSLAREIARAHQGDLVLNPYREEMVSFTLTLPLI